MPGRVPGLYIQQPGKKPVYGVHVMGVHIGAMHLSNTIEPSVSGGDAACQTTQHFLKHHFR